jgi:hypothetical protein
MNENVVEVINFEAIHKEGKLARLLCYEVADNPYVDNRAEYWENGYMGRELELV